MKAPLRQKSAIHYNTFCSSALLQKLESWWFSLLCRQMFDMQVTDEQVMHMHTYCVYVYMCV